MAKIFVMSDNLQHRVELVAEEDDDGAYVMRCTTHGQPAVEDYPPHPLADVVAWAEVHVDRGW